MRVGKPSFLVIERAPGTSRRRVRFSPSLADVLREWVPSTRVSPVYTAQGTRSDSPPDFPFNGEQTLLLVGPAHPDTFIASCGVPKRMWLGWGLFNLLLVPASKQQETKILSWAKREGVAVESWRVKDGEVVRFPAPPRGIELGADWRNEIAVLADLQLPGELHEAVVEYCPLAASTFSRSRQHLSRLGLSSDLQSVNELIAELLSDLKPQGHVAHDEMAAYQVLGELLTVNAGLSRFASQTFAGISPVPETECHFWSHSALGIGIASLALWRLRRFLDATLGAARLPERFAGLARVTANVPDLCTLPSADPFWLTDHLGTPEGPNGSDQPLVPVLTYYSSRDGYRSTSTTLSAPLAAVSACNSLQWSLLTTTHEVSHIVVRSVLADLYPDLDSTHELQDALNLFERKRPAANLLEEIRRYLLLAIVKMDDVATDRVGTLDVDEETLLALLDHWHHEVEEIFVHAFDFLYFYGRDTDKYVRGIWVSWGTIPNVANRVPEYVVRTICAVLSSHLLKGSDAEETAKEQVLRALINLEKSRLGGPYVKKAIKHIQQHWQDSIQQEVFARKALVRIAVGFLFSQSIATTLRGEPAISGDASRHREGYTLRVEHFEHKRIRNPLRFLELFTTSATPSAAASMWMLYVLAFCVEGNGN